MGGILLHPVDHAKPLSNIRLIDAGDIPVPLAYDKTRSDDIMLAAQSELLKVLQQVKEVDGHAFILGGSDDLSLAVIKSSEQAAVHLDACLDVKGKQIVQLDDLEPTTHETSKSYLREYLGTDGHQPVTIYGL